VTSCTLKKAPRLKVESLKDIVSEYVANTAWQEVVLDEGMLKMTNGSSLLLAEVVDDKKW
jgi:hypothetical protein